MYQSKTSGYSLVEVICTFVITFILVSISLHCYLKIVKGIRGQAIFYPLSGLWNCELDGRPVNIEISPAVEKNQNGMDIVGTYWDGLWEEDGELLFFPQGHDSSTDELKLGLFEKKSNTSESSLIINTKTSNGYVLEGESDWGGGEYPFSCSRIS